MLRVFLQGIVILTALFALVVQDGMAKTLSREEVDALWEDRLRQEQYFQITGPDDNNILAEENREAYLWGFFGLSYGGGWSIGGHFEAEVPIEEGLLQLYSKATSYWSPGFELFLLEPRYDRNKYPIWEFRLILRDPVRRQEIQTLKSIPLPDKEVKRGYRRSRFDSEDKAIQDSEGNVVYDVFPPGAEECPTGQRCPRGELRYDATRKTATIQILGVYHPVTVEVPLSHLPTPTESKTE